MSDIAQAEKFIIDIVKARGGNARGGSLLTSVSNRVPMTVAHAAYWGLIKDGKMSLDNGHVSLTGDGDD